VIIGAPRVTIQSTHAAATVDREAEAAAQTYFTAALIEV